MLKSAAATLIVVAGFAVGLATGASLRVAPAGKVTCLGNIATFDNITWNNVAYTQRESGDLAAAVSEAVCKRRFRSIIHVVPAIREAAE